MKSLTTSENAGKAPNTSVRESPSFRFGLKGAPPLSLLVSSWQPQDSPAGLWDVIASCLAPVPGASPPPSPPTSMGPCSLSHPNQPCLAVDQALPWHSAHTCTHTQAQTPVHSQHFTRHFCVCTSVIGSLHGKVLKGFQLNTQALVQPAAPTE